MYATAHRVSRQDQSGVNAFLYLHGRSFPWPQDASRLPEDAPGTPDPGHRMISLPPGSNTVNSYLDVLAPDGTPKAELHQTLELLRRDLSERRNPTVLTLGRVTLRFGVQIGLESKRKAELDTLLEAVTQVLPDD